MKKRVSLLLVVAMLLTMLPFAASAAEATELISVTDASVTTAGYTFEYTAEAAGTLTVNAGTCSPGWRYKVYEPDGTESIYKTKWAASHEYQITPGNWKIVFYAYSSAEADNVAGTVSFSVSFTPAEGEVEVQKAEYAVSETPLVMGDNTVSMLDTAETTIFVFEPTETAVYTFTVSAGTLGYWGAGSWFLQNPNSTTNTYEWTCTGVGQTAYMGVSGVEGDVTVTVEKTGDYTVVEIPVVPYENKAELAPFEKPEGATWTGYVDVYGETHTAVLGDDGYYHLDSADGDVLVVNLKYQDIILSNALYSDRPVMYAYMTNEDGSQYKYDIGDAIQAYEAVMDANGNYPLTEDLLLFYQVYAMQAGTFTYHLSGKYNEECVWMYCMRTMNMDNVVVDPSEPETEPTEPSQPETEPSEPETEPSEPETEPTPSVPVAGEVVLNESVTAVAASKYVYTYKPTEDGTLTITVGDGSTTWSSDIVYFQGVTMKTVATANGSAAATYSAEVTANTSYRVRVWNNSTALAATPLMVVFTPAGGTEPSEPETEPTTPSEPETEPTEPSVPESSEPTPSEPTDSVTVATVTDVAVTAAAGYVVEYKNAPAGTLNVSVGTCTPGWRYKVFSPDGVESGYRSKYTAGTSCDYHNVAGNWKIVFYAYSSAEADNVDGTVNFTVTFTPDETQPEVQKDPYKISASLLNVGANNVTMEETAEATIFRFKPTEAGTYTVTGPDGSLVGIWGYSSSYLNNPNSTSNSFEWECANVGPSIFVGVVGAEGQIVLTVEKAFVEPEPSEPETEPSEPETEPSEPETEPSEPETEPTVPSIPDEDVPAGTYYSITENGQTTYYSVFTPANMNANLKKITGTAYVKLYQDLPLGTSVYNCLDLKTGNITIDLNGYVVSGNYAGMGCVYVDGANVTIVDTSAAGTGAFVNTHNSGHGIYVWSGTCTMQSGKVEAKSNGIRVENGGTFHMQGGTVIGGGYGIYVSANSFATVSGGYITHTKTSLAYPMYVNSTATVSVTGGYFSGSAISGGGLAGKVSGGFFSKKFSASYLAADCEFQDNADATYLFMVFNPNAQPEEPAPVYVAQVGDTQHTTLAEAIAAAIANNQVVKLLTDCAEDVTVNADLYLDLNGFDILGTVIVAEGATLYGMDSTTDDYDCTDGYGKISTIVGSYAKHYKIEADSAVGKIMRYMAISEEDGISFHRFYLGIQTVSLKPGVTGFGYTAIFGGDTMIQAALGQDNAFGYALWLDGGDKVTKGMSKDAFVTGKDGKTLTLRLKNFDITNYGDAQVHAQVYITLADGTKIESGEYSCSMKEMLETVNANIANYSDTQIKAVQTMLAPYADAVSQWNIADLLNWKEQEVE